MGYDVGKIVNFAKRCADGDFHNLELVREAAVAALAKNPLAWKWSQKGQYWHSGACRYRILVSNEGLFEALESGHSVGTFDEISLAKKVCEDRYQANRAPASATKP